MAIDSTTVEAKGEVGCGGFKHRRGTKIHVIVDGGSKPTALGPGNMHDSKMFSNLYGKIRCKPERIYGDSAYDTDEVRDRLGVKANISVNPGNGVYILSGLCLKV